MLQFLPGDQMHDPIASSFACTAVKTTTCYMSDCCCRIRVHPRDGLVRYIGGDPDRVPVNRVIRAKGSSGIMKQVSAARLTPPLLRYVDRHDVMSTLDRPISKHHDELHPERERAMPGPTRLFLVDGLYEPAVPWELGSQC